MPKSLADGKIKFTILTTPPVDPAAPTAVELNAGIDLSCTVLDSDFQWSATDSDKVSEKPLCEAANVNALGASNYQAGMTLFRSFDTSTKNSHITEDAGFTAVKVKGTTVHGYARKTAKSSDEAWADADEIYMGAEVLTDNPQEPSDMGGYIKTRIPMEVQRAWLNIVVGGVGSPSSP